MSSEVEIEKQIEAIVESNATSGEDLVQCTSQIVAACAQSTSLSPDDLLSLISKVHQKLYELRHHHEPQSELRPAVPIEDSVTDNYIICLEDGKQFKMLKKHLMSIYGLTPQEYRRKWGLPADYPMTAPSYAKRRQELAKEIGLGLNKRT